MAIQLDIIELKGLPKETGTSVAIYYMPPEQVTRVLVGGLYPLSKYADTIILRNAGDPVYVRLSVNGDVVQAGSGDSKSVFVGTGSEFPFQIFNYINDLTYGIDIRAA